MNRRFELDTFVRDADIAHALQNEGVGCQGFNGTLLVRPAALLTGAGRPYRVFTPFLKAQGVDPLIPDLEHMPAPARILTLERRGTISPTGGRIPLRLTGRAASNGHLARLAQVRRYRRSWRTDSRTTLQVATFQVVPGRRVCRPICIAAKSVRGAWCRTRGALSHRAARAPPRWASSSPRSLGGTFPPTCCTSFPICPSALSGPIRAIGTE